MFFTTQKNCSNKSGLISYDYMIRSGMIRKISSGIYTWLPMGRRVLNNIQNIIRSEMEKLHALEVSMPSVLPLKFLYETGRLKKFGRELLQLTDRCKKPFYYAPTHEECIVNFIRNDVKSYKQLPLTFYQIQTKFRDEIRPCAGVIRAREFIMKDAYSFHLNDRSLEKTYKDFHDSYCNILNKMGLNFLVAEADSGSIGGDVTHEFQVLSSAGHDNIVHNSEGKYVSNVESANNYKLPSKEVKPSSHLKKVRCIDSDSITHLLKDKGMSLSNYVKTIVIKDSNKRLFALIVCYDHEINLLKVGKLKQVSSPCTYVSEEEIYILTSINKIFLGPVYSMFDIIVDYSVSVKDDFTCGSNEKGYLYFYCNLLRDVKNFSVAEIRNVVKGDVSPDGNSVLDISKGFEVGHIFKLGDYYSRMMKANIMSQNGTLQPVLMGCYGLGVSRIVAAAIEQCHDSRGIIWPKSISPYDVIIIPINMFDSSKVCEFAQALYDNLKLANIEVLFDDRNKSPGFMFADADLVGVPHHIIVSDRTLNNHCVEYRCRKNGVSKDISFDVETILKYLV